MIHISPWTCTKALFEESKSYLNNNNFLMIYGPFLRANVKNPKSNLNFDQTLRLQNPLWGLRSFENVNKIAIKSGFILEKIIDMPANNLSVIFRMI